MPGGLPAFNKWLPLLVIVEVVRKDIMDGVWGWLGRMDQNHIGFFEGSAAFYMVALGAGGHHVFPGLLSTEVAGDDMIQGEVGFLSPTVLAGKVVTAEQLRAG